MDVDGTLTDEKIYIGNNEELMKAFSIKDGYAITHLLPKPNIMPVIITGQNQTLLVNDVRSLELNLYFKIF